MIKYCTIPIIAVLLVLSMNSCMAGDGYTRAVEYWDKQAYAAAMNFFVEDPNYKDSAAYIERFETQVIASLVQTPWCCDTAYYTSFDQTGTRLDYQFSEDGTVLRRTQLWSGSRGDTQSLKSYDDFTFSYYLYYDVNDETGIYEARIRIGPDHNYHDYVLKLGVEDDRIVVLGFVGDIEVEDPSLAEHKSILVERYFSRDTSLPEYGENIFSQSQNTSSVSNIIDSFYLREDSTKRNQALAQNLDSYQLLTDTEIKTLLNGYWITVGTNTYGWWHMYQFQSDGARTHVGQFSEAGTNYMLNKTPQNDVWSCVNGLLSFAPVDTKDTAPYQIRKLTEGYYILNIEGNDVPAYLLIQANEDGNAAHTYK